jgi:HlyD family secretion protein
VSSLKKAAIGGAVVVVGLAAVFMARSFGEADAPEVRGEPIARRNLLAQVSASGTIQPQLTVDISASVMGRVTRLAVNEGDRVTAGQFLLQIDPESLQSAVDRGEASFKASQSTQEQAKVAVATAKVTLEQAQDNLERQQELWELRLISREVYDQAVTEVRLRETELQAREVEVSTAAQRIQQERAMLDSARYDLDQVTIVAPMDGIVTRRNIEEGETVVVGTMNNAGTVLMTIADFSILEAEVEVDETDIPSVRFGQEAEITIDALPDRTYRGRVTEIGNSPIQEAGQGSGNTTQATNFKVVVTLDDNVPEVRPGFTCTADITTATRTATLAVPIQATTVRDVTLNAMGEVVRAPRRDDNLPNISSPLAAASEPWNDATKEREGVFVVRENQVQFIPIVTGIAGEQYFEVLDGLNEGDMVITGPFDVVRSLDDGDTVQLDERSSDR